MKVLGVGLGRTGTASLNQALTILGYRSRHFDTTFMSLVEAASTTGHLDLSSYDNVDALTDNPTNLFYEEFLERYPLLKFILTIRDEDSWVKSVTQLYLKRPTNSLKRPRYSDEFIRTALYSRACAFGSVTVNEFLLRKRFRDWNRHVISNIDPARLLVMSVADGWEPLCRFLDKPIPETPFPWLNRHK